MVSVQRTSTGEPALYKVRIGPLGSEGEAKAISARLVRLGVEEPRRIWN
jgi:rare lipoprotein A